MRSLLLILTALSLTWSSTSWSYAVEGVPCARADAHASGARAEWGGSKGRLLYAQQRWLDPTTGRFLSLDPVQGVLSEPLSTQGFIYGRANPTRFIDPDGRQDAMSAILGMQRMQLCPTGNEPTCATVRAHENFAIGATGGAAVSGGCLLMPQLCISGMVAAGAGMLTSGAPTVALAEDIAATTGSCFSDDIFLMNDAEVENCQFLAGGLVAGAPELLTGLGLRALFLVGLLTTDLAAATSKPWTWSLESLQNERAKIHKGASGAMGRWRQNIYAVVFP